MPVLGRFHDDNPYRDFDEEKGIFSHDRDDGVIEWIKGGSPPLLVNGVNIPGADPDPKCVDGLGKYNQTCIASRSGSVPNKLFNMPRFRTQSSSAGNSNLGSGFKSPKTDSLPLITCLSSVTVA